MNPSTPMKIAKPFNASTAPYPDSPTKSVNAKAFFTKLNNIVAEANLASKQTTNNNLLR